MFAIPPRLDLWLVSHLAMWWGGAPALDLAIDQGVGYGVLGGLWYAAAVFLTWVQGAQPAYPMFRRRTLTIALGSLVAAGFTVFLGAVLAWPPPSAHPVLAGLYPDDFPVNLNANSFPSQSTALYASVAAGIYSLRRGLGTWAWIGVLLLVALPRVYLGGHHVTDVLGGLLAGLGGYRVARLLEGVAVSRFEVVFDHDWDRWQRTMGEVAVYLWILQVATEFRHVVWIAEMLGSISR